MFEKILHFLAYFHSFILRASDLNMRKFNRYVCRSLCLCRKKEWIGICTDVFIDVLAFLTRHQLAKIEASCRYVRRLVDTFFSKTPYLMFDRLVIDNAKLSDYKHVSRTRRYVFWHKQTTTYQRIFNERCHEWKIKAEADEGEVSKIVSCLRSFAKEGSFPFGHL